MLLVYAQTRAHDRARWKLEADNLSFYLGGKSRRDEDSWVPNKEAVLSTIKFAIATRRLDKEMENTNGTTTVTTLYPSS